MVMKWRWTGGGRASCWRGLALSLCISLLLLSYLLYAARPSPSLQPQAEQAPYVELANPEPVYTAKVIVLSYMRSGSSLTADVIQQHPGVFYVFEPLMTVNNLKKLYMPQMFLEKPIKFVKPGTENEVLDKILTCSLQDVDILTLHQYHMDKSQSTLPYYRCLWQTPGRYWEKTCLQPFKKLCEVSPVRLIKTIRLAINDTQALLDKHPDLKLVHLVRDPRGVTVSRAYLYYSKFEWGQLLSMYTRKAKELCNTMASDLSDVHRLAAQYPGRVAILQYERLAVAPLELAQRLYEFLGIPYTDTVAQYVFNITSAGRNDSCSLCTTRADSVYTAFKWRQVLDHAHSSQIDAICSAVYQWLGYVPFDSDADLKDMTKSSYSIVQSPIML